MEAYVLSQDSSVGRLFGISTFRDLLPEGPKSCQRAVKNAAEDASGNYIKFWTAR